MKNNADTTDMNPNIMALKYLLLIMITITTIVANAQEKVAESKEVKGKNFHLGITVSPDLCYRTLHNNHGSTIDRDIIALRNENEIYKLGYTAGLNLCIPITSYLDFETGILFSNKGYQTKYQNSNFPSHPSNIVKTKFIYNDYYTDIPLKLNLLTGKNKFRFFLSLGVTTNFFKSETSNSVVVYTDHKERKSSLLDYKYKKINISPTIGFGIDSRINNTMRLRIEPAFRYGLLKIIDDSITGFLYNIGINITYYYRLTSKYNTLNNSKQ